MYLFLHKAHLSVFDGDHIDAWDKASDVERSVIALLQHQATVEVIHADSFVVGILHKERVTGRVGPEGDAVPLWVSDTLVIGH